MPLVELSQRTVNLIKSSQVINSFTSIVKELIENSLDAKATILSVKLENFGFDKLEVKDNGHGIKEDDVQYIAKPHFTSKIENFEDLDNLSSYGFRGEALSSLCAVSEVSVNTKSEYDSHGFTYSLNNCGDIKCKKPAAVTTGTSISVKNLFKNIPVRRQYYSNNRRKKEELKKIEHIVMSFAIIKPNVHLTLLHEKSIVFQKPSSTDNKTAVHFVFRDLAKNLIYKKQEFENVQIQIWLPKSEAQGCSLSSSDRLFLFVNDRSVSHKAIEKLIKAYYSQKSEGAHGRYPIGVIILSVPTNAIDVNLEPNKTKIYFQDEKYILSCIQEILNELYGPVLQNINKAGSQSLEDVLPCTFASSQLKDLQPGEPQGSKSQDSHISKSEFASNKETNSKGYKIYLEPSQPLHKSEASSCHPGNTSTTHHKSLVDNQQENLNENQVDLNLISNSSTNITTTITPTTTTTNITTTAVNTTNNEGCGISRLRLNENINFNNTLEDKNKEDKSEDHSLLFNSAAENEKYNQDRRPTKELNNVIQLPNEAPMEVEDENLINDENKRLERQLIAPFNKDKETNTLENQNPWSRGHLYSEKGDNIQSVEVLKPPEVLRDRNGPEIRIKRKSIDASPESKKSPVINKKYKMTPQKMSELPLPTEKPGAKPETAFSLFAKTYRKQVIEENPGSDFTVIAQELANRWKSADAATKQRFEERAFEIRNCTESSTTSIPINNLTLPVNEKSKEKSLNFKCLSLSGSSEKRSGSQPNLKSQSMRKAKPWQEKSLLVQLDIDSLKRKIRQNKRMNLPTEAIIGNVIGVNGWIYRIKNSICAFNTSRMNEIILYKSLVESFTVPVIKLEDPIQLNQSNLGDQNWSILLSLDRRTSTINNEFSVLDPRINSNGFKVILIKGDGTEIKCGEIISVADSVPNYGIEDFKEILHKLFMDPNLPLEKTRPLILQKWLKDQSMRMSRAAPHIRDASVLIEKLNMWHKLDSQNQRNVNVTCLHEKPVFEVIKTI